MVEAVIAEALWPLRDRQHETVESTSPPAGNRAMGWGDAELCGVGLDGPETLYSRLRLGRTRM